MFHQIRKAGLTTVRIDQKEESILAVANPRSEPSVPLQTLDPLRQYLHERSGGRVGPGDVDAPDPWLYPALQHVRALGEVFAEELEHLVTFQTTTARFPGGHAAVP